MTATRTPLLSIPSSIPHSCLRIFFLLAALTAPHPSFAGVATFAGLEDEILLQAEGLTKVTASPNGYQLTGGSSNFTDECTGPVNDHVAIKENIISELNPEITSLLGTSDWEITLQLDPSGEGLTQRMGQAWGIGITFGNGFNQLTSATGEGNFGRGASLIFGFTDTQADIVTFPVLTPYALLVGADLSSGPDGQFFNFFNAVDYTQDDSPPDAFFQNFMGTRGTIILSRRGVDEFGRPVVTIGSTAERRPSTWGWLAGNTGTPGPPVVEANFWPFGLAPVGGSSGGFGSQNINFNGLIPAEAAPPESAEPIGMPVTNLFLFVENETSWVQYSDPSFPDDPFIPDNLPFPDDPSDTSDECFGTEPTPEESATYSVDFDFPADDPGEVDANDTAGFRAMLTGRRDDINAYGNVDELRTLLDGAGKFGCLTIVSDAIPDINPDSDCGGPRITENPESAVVDLTTGLPVPDVTFSVVAESESELAYQWIKDGRPIGTVREVLLGEVVAGQSLSPNEGNGILQVTAFDASAAVDEIWTFIAQSGPPVAIFSAVGTETGRAPNVIATADPIEFAVADYLSVKIAEGSIPFRHGDRFELRVEVAEPENPTADDPDLIITGATKNDEAAYRVRVTDDTGHTLSRAARLTVIDFPPNTVRTWREYE